jgi:teichuronic acid biosynthesis glycosyltransferase TuaG
MKKDLCSVVIPAYKCASFIDETLNSVLGQTYPELEIIVVNDCSPDHTEEIILEYCSRDARIRYLKNEINQGVAETRNRGVRAARGKWIALVDSDDCWEPNKIEAQMELVKEKNALLCYTGCQFMNNQGRLIGRVFNVPETVDYAQLLYQNVIVCSSVLISRELLLEHPMYGDHMHEDYITWLHILKEQKAYGINAPLVRYRIADNSKTRNKFKSIQMTYHVYRHMQLNLWQAHYYLAANMLNGLKKYGKHAFL